jgi:hypothetical protein
MLYSTDRKRGVSLIFVNHQFFGNLLKKWIDKIRMYNKDGTRLQNKGVNLIVCLIFWTLKWFMYDTHLTVYSVTDFVQKIGQITLFKLFWVTMMIEMFHELLRKVLHTRYLLFSYQSVWNACCLNIAPKGCVSWFGKEARTPI